MAEGKGGRWEVGGGRCDRQRTAASTLLRWYAANARDLPWRRTRDPYRILVSEMMLQQTQVDRVLPFYACFLKQFPDAATLAVAGDEAIHRAWKGLGYPSRVERLRAACRQVVAAGAWPDTASGLQELPGIGPYTAAAVASFAFARPEPLVDTNVARILVRRDGLPAERKTLWVAAAAGMHREDPIAWNNALMELGATVCTARAPRCAVCPWADLCKTRGDAGRVEASANPLRAAAPRVAYGDPAPPRGAERTHVVLALVHDQGRYLVARRPQGVHCAGAWELPGGKREPGEDDRTALARELREELGAEVLAARHLLTWHHAYPDRHLTLHAYRVRLFDPGAVKPLASRGLRWLAPEEIAALDMPPANRALQMRLSRYHRLGPSNPQVKDRLHL